MEMWCMFAASAQGAFSAERPLSWPSEFECGTSAGAESPCACPPLHPHGSSRLPALVGDAFLSVVSPVSEGVEIDEGPVTPKFDAA